MSHRISQNLRGALGEIFVEREFEEFELIDLRQCTYPNLPELPPEPPEVSEDSKEYPKYLKRWSVWQRNCNRKIINKYGTVIFPDYLIKGTKIFLEVKTGKSAKLEKDQIKEFSKLLENGFRVFIIKPKLLIEKRKSSIHYYTEFFMNVKTRVFMLEGR